MRLLFAVLAAALVALPAEAQRTIRVPGEAPTIQAGIDMAQAGDTVLLADGVYRGTGNKSLVMGPRDITVRSEGGAAGCVIDLEQVGRAMHFYQGQTAGYVVEGITFRNGNKPDKGGAIWISGASPTIRDCVFEDCASYNGGAISLEESASRIAGSVFRRCGSAAAGSTGGGVLVSGSAPTLDGCEFSDCSAERGAGAAAHGCHIDVVDCTFRSGDALAGSALWIAADASAALVDCMVSGNSTTDREGGAIHVIGTAAALRTTLAGNDGAGLFGEGTVMLEACVAADHDGTAMDLRGDSTLSGCTFEGNGGGVNFFDRGGRFPKYVVRGSEFRGNERAISCGGSSASVEDCLFVGNESIGSGDVTGYTLGPRFERCEFRENQGGLHGYSSAVDSSFVDNGPDFRVEGGDFIRCEFARNTGRSSILGWWAGISLHGCLIVENTMTEASDRSALVASGGWLTLVNCTVMGNTGPAGAPTFFAHATTDQRGTPTPGALHIRNSVIEDTGPLAYTRDYGGHPLELYGVRVEVDFSVAPAGSGAVELSPHSELVWGDHNLLADPRLADPAAGDYSLAPGSPCIDAGDSAAAWISWLEPVDLAGQPRFHDDPGTPDRGAPDPLRPGLPIVDIGAFEFQGESPCRADLDGDGELTFFDFIAFQNLFSAGDVRADFDFDGALTFFDFLAFQGSFAAVCG